VFHTASLLRGDRECKKATQVETRGRPHPAYTRVQDQGVGYIGSIPRTFENDSNGLSAPYRS
jgi:hypothetical protein